MRTNAIFELFPHSKDLQEHLKTLHIQQQLRIPQCCWDHCSFSAAASPGRTPPYPGKAAQCCPSPSSPPQLSLLSLWISVLSSSSVSASCRSCERISSCRLKQEQNQRTEEAGKESWSHQNPKDQLLDSPARTWSRSALRRSELSAAPRWPGNSCWRRPTLEELPWVLPLPWRPGPACS